MISKVTHVTVYVSSQDDAKAFYAGKLGWEVVNDDSFGEGMRWLTVRIPGDSIEIALWRGDGEKGGTVGGFTGLVLHCDEIDKTYEELKEKGVMFPAPPADVPWGRHAMMSDPDGNQFNLVQPAHFAG